MTSGNEIHIFESEYQAIIGEAQRHPDSETGGDLYGTFTHGDMPVIWLASGPGPRSSRTGVEFAQDPAFINYWQRKLMAEFALQYVGSWHSHHKMTLTVLSQGDVAAVMQYAQSHHRSRTIELLVNHAPAVDGQPRSTIRPYYYPKAETGVYYMLDLHILPRESPIRPLLLDEVELFSAGLDVRSVAQPTAQIPANATVQRVHKRAPMEIPVRDHGTIQPSSHGDELVAAVELDSKLVEVIRELGDVGEIGVSQKPNCYILELALSDSNSVALAVETAPYLKLIQVNTIDRSRPDSPTTISIARQLLRAGIEMPCRVYKTRDIGRVIEIAKKLDEFKRKPSKWRAFWKGW